jgi:serine/threonine-protein kinase
LLVGIGIALAIGGIGLAFGLGQGIFSSNGNNTQEVNGSRGSCKVVSGGLNIRSSPKGSVIKTVQKGTNLSLTGTEEKGWVEISSPVNGWVYQRSDLIDCTSPSQIPIETAVNPKPVETTASQTPIETIPTQKPVEASKPKPSIVRPKPVDNSSKALETAADKYESGDLQGAIADAQKIPPSSDAFKDAQAKIQQWQQEWSTTKAKFDELQKALDEGRWDVVFKAAVDPKFLEQRYWREQLNKLIEEAKKRKAEAEAEANKEQTTPPEASEPQKPQPEPTSSETQSPNSAGESQTTPETPR